MSKAIQNRRSQSHCVLLPIKCGFQKMHGNPLVADTKILEIADDYGFKEVLYRFECRHPVLGHFESLQHVFHLCLGCLPALGLPRQKHEHQSNWKKRYESADYQYSVYFLTANH
jgi:hypothetical protein